ncbi:MAG: hypothetical protein KDI19_15050 [Pseudomonadales bacterium]|nr:hypothetical protein [Pseudomonadales bacterium]
MHQIIFVGSEDEVSDLELDENPADSFPCMSSQQYFRDARAQLYSIVSGVFLDEALEMENVFKALTEEGPFIYRLDREMQEQLARLDEDAIAEYAELWVECEEIEQLDTEVNDLYEFLYGLVHFCLTAQDEDMGVFIYSD